MRNLWLDIKYVFFCHFGWNCNRNRTLILAQKSNRYSIGQFDAVLKEYYSSDFAKKVASETNAFMSFIKKQHSNTMFVVADERVSPDRMYGVSWEGLSKYVPAADPAKPEEAMDTFEDRVVREIPEKITSYAPPSEAYREGWERTFGEQKPPEPPRCGGCDEVHCECDEHDPDCEKLCTQGSNCNCRRAGLI